jgi:hypothetical protein
LEGDLRELFWRYSYWELKKKIELKVGEVSASHMTLFTAVAEVASAVFGNGKETPRGAPETRGDITENLAGADPAAFKARVNQLFSGG